MSTSGWTMAAGGAGGLALAIFGVRMLITGRAPAPTERAFRTVRDAGFYHLLFGTALLLVVIGTGLAGSVFPAVAAFAGLLLVSTAVIRFRPRPRSRHDADGK